MSRIVNNLYILKGDSKEKIDKKSGEIIWKTRYRLHFGSDLFKQMPNVRKDSLNRKKPNDLKN